MTFKRAINVVSSACLVATFAAACGGHGQAASSTSITAGGDAAQPIKIGLICSCSGAFGSAMVPSEDVYIAWVKTINAAGGIQGHRIDLTTYDDQANPGTSVSDMQSIISDHVDAVVDYSLVDSTWATAIASAKIPVVGGNISEEPFFTNSDFYPNGETDNAPSAAGVAAEAGLKKVAYFYCTESPDCSEKASEISGQAEKVGVAVVYKGAISATAPNYTAQCLAAKQAGAVAIINGDSDAVFERVASDCSKQSYRPAYISSGLAFDPSMLTTDGIEQNSWYEGNNLPYFAQNQAVQAMTRAVKKYYPNILNKPQVWTGASVQSWAAGLLLSDAVKGSGLTATETPTAQKIADGLASLKDDTLEGLSPPLTFIPGKAHTVDCWFTFRVINSQPSMSNNSRVSCATP